MCGIAGIWQLDGRKVEATVITHFVRALAHRGPDGEGVVIEDDGRLALGHRRLVILDPSAASDQPMRSASGRYDITYNGEVYNFLELRRDLEVEGFRFRSDGDTEVVLAAFERWGPDCLLRFNGMWSLAIWDRRRRALFLARDRFGIKPLYVAAAPHRFAFASELKAFLYLDGFEAVADREALEARLAHNLVDHVLLSRVERVPAGHWMEVTPEGTRCRRWWSTLEHLVSVPKAFDRQAEGFRDLLLDACRLRLRCDVPVATALSGGVDSSSVVCSLAAGQQSRGFDRQAPEWRRAFIACYPGTTKQETEYALLAAKQAGAVPVLRQMSAGNLAADVDEYLYQFEDIGGLYGLPAWALYREMRREGVVVSLDGHGGDELVGGYDVHIYLALLLGGGVLKAPRRTLDLIDTLRALYPSEKPPSRIALAAWTIPAMQAAARIVSRLPMAEGLRRRQEMLAAVVGRHAFDGVSESDENAHAKKLAADALGPLTGALYHSFHRESLPRILRDFDAHSMGHGVEVRMPLLDWRLVCYAFSCPDESKIGRGYTKRLLRESMRGIVPDAVRLRRDKIGFTAPVAAWLDGALADWLEGELNDPEFLRSELWDGPALRALAQSKRVAGERWRSAEARRVALAVTAHWWQTRWLRSAKRPPAATTASRA